MVQAAGRLFRERGIDGVGVAEISKKAGLTHGALYASFPPRRPWQRKPSHPPLNPAWRK